MAVMVDTKVGACTWVADGVALEVQRVEVVTDGDEVVSATVVARLPPGVRLDTPAFHATVPAGDITFVQLGAGASMLESPVLAPSAEAVWEALSTGSPPVADADGWYLLAVDGDSGPLATGWSACRWLGGDQPALPDPLRRAVAVLAAEGLEPVWSPVNPHVVVAGVDPGDGWTLGVAVDLDDALTIAQVVAPAPGQRFAGDGPVASGMALVDVAVDGDRMVCSAAVRGLGADVDADTVAGLVAAVLDVAGRLSEPG